MEKRADGKGGEGNSPKVKVNRINTVQWPSHPQTSSRELEVTTRVAKPSMNLLQRTGSDHQGGQAIHEPPPENWK